MTSFQRRSNADSTPPPVFEEYLDAEAVTRVEKLLGYTFTNRRLLAEALMHRSFAGEQQTAASYERLEFLGDAVLQLAV
ncbi:MAG: ribonuclease III, partial [Acidobacteria bacterium]|nr:ribonuclease III [Acidobacteriota bacterium]NIQ84729.1 ribonuclease III [Acidobacteriota bacterium]